MAEWLVNRKQEGWGSRRRLGQAVSSAVLTGTSVEKDWVTASVWKTLCTRGSRADKSLATTVVCESGRGGTDLCRNVKDTGASEANKKRYFILSHSLKGQKLD